MPSEEKYRTVAEVAADSGCWDTFVSVAHKPVEEQVAWLEEVFFAAARRHDDKAAARYVAFICHALDDAQLKPLFTDDQHGRISGGPVVSEAQQRAQQARVEKMMELYLKLPTHKEGKAREIIAEDESRLVDVDGPTLIETRRAMLTEVAARWKLTKDEEEAARLFRFLQSRELHFEPEKKMFREVLYKATDASFPSTRLVQALLALGPYDDLGSGDRRELGRILAIAWARNSDLHNVARQLRTVQPLVVCSDAACALVEEFARASAALDEKAHRLKEAMRVGRLEVGRRIYGEITISYPRPGVVECAIAQRLDWSERFDENQGHETFELAKQFVRQWQDTNRHAVNLRLSVAGRYGHDKEPRFKRELYLDVAATA